MRWIKLGMILAFLLPQAAMAAPQAVASIKPLHALVSRVMEGVAEPVLLLEGHASPHDYQLRPSDRRRLAEADLVFFIGAEYEFFLKPLVNNNEKWVDLSTAPELALYPIRHPDEEDHTHRHENAAADMHYWLDPANAQHMVDAIAEALSDKDPQHAALYGANAARLKKELATLDEELAATYTPVAGRPFFTFHDATQYLEKRYGLQNAGSITAHPGQPMSAHRLATLRERMAKENITCVLQEPPYDARQIQALTKDANVRTGKLDPEALELKPAPNLYFILLRQIAEGMKKCLE